MIMHSEHLSKENINELIITYITGNATAEEAGFLYRWVNLSKENKEIFENKKLTWMAGCQTNQHAHRELLDQKLFEIHQQIKNSQGRRVVKKSSSSKNLLYFNLKKITKVAALFLLIFILGGLASFYIFKKTFVSNPHFLSAIEAPLGSRAVAYLPDGTKVWLNAGSKLEYSNTYDVKKREVKLTGEGFFNVKTNPDKPFIVRASNLSIKACGTSFNVKAYPDEKEVITTLVEGKVEIEGLGSNSKIFKYHLKPKQKVTYYTDRKLFNLITEQEEKTEGAENSSHKRKDNIIPLKQIAPLVADIDVKTELYTSWKDDRWIIESEKLGDLSKMIERRFNVDITFGAEELKNYRFSGTIQNETLEQILGIMRLTIPLSYKIDNGLVVINMDTTLKSRYKSAYKK